MPLYAPQLGIASAELSTALAAQRSGSARAASSGPPALCFYTFSHGLTAENVVSRMRADIARAAGGRGGWVSSHIVGVYHISAPRSVLISAARDQPTIYFRDVVTGGAILEMRRVGRIEWGRRAADVCSQ